MSKEVIRPCPICSCIDKIETKREIITKFDYGEDKVRVYAFCRNCGHRSLAVYGRYSENEGERAAIQVWNNQ